jgi:hypothetical protein
MPAFAVATPPKAAEKISETPAGHVKPVLVNRKCSAEDIGSSTSSPVKVKDFVIFREGYATWVLSH